jgi:transcription antitermination factor NusG
MNWYAIYTKPRWEKKVAQNLIQQGIECYCPLSKSKRQWTDRTVTLELPVIPSYIFVRIPKEDTTKIRYFAGVVNFVYQQGQIAVIRDKEIESFKNFINKYEDYSISSEFVKTGETIKINSRILGNQVATVASVINKTIQIKLGGMIVRLNIKKNSLKQ